jgi:hypothetical protein
MLLVGAGGGSPPFNCYRFRLAVWKDANVATVVVLPSFAVLGSPEALVAVVMHRLERPRRENLCVVTFGLRTCFGLVPFAQVRQMTAFRSPLRGPRTAFSHNCHDFTQLSRFHTTVTNGNSHDCRELHFHTRTAFLHNSHERQSAQPSRTAFSHNCHKCQFHTTNRTCALPISHNCHQPHVLVFSAPRSPVAKIRYQPPAIFSAGGDRLLTLDAITSVGDYANQNTTRCLFLSSFLPVQTHQNLCKHVQPALSRVPTVPLTKPCGRHSVATSTNIYRTTNIHQHPS